MINYSTWYHKGTANILFCVKMSYKEAIKNAKEVLRGGLLDSVDIVNMDTNKVFITLHTIRHGSK